MRILVHISFLLTFFILAEGYAQNIQGVATYKTQRKVEIELDSTQMNDDMRNQIMSMLKKQFEREYTLEFTEEESLYKQVEELDAGPAMGAGVQVVVAGSGDSDILYNNLKEQRFANMNEMFGKMFLIKDSITTRDWQMEKETKNIGDYTCFKATYTYERDEMRMRSSSDDETEEEPKKETITVTAWYTPQIPVSSGPAEFNGLPGLILEVSDGELSILCSKVVINPKNGVKIKEPNNGKVVTQEKYDEILEKKMKEMDEQFQSDGRRNDGNSIEIRIGG